MPNWVYNKITIRGNEKDLHAVSERLKPRDPKDQAGPISFDSLIPRPKDQDEDWYNWNVANWGSKWDACHAESQMTPPSTTDGLGTLVYTFDTAWSPPVGVIDKFIDEFKHLSMDYAYEEEQGWGGTLKTLGGKIVEQTEYDIPNSHREMLERSGSCWCDNYNEPTAVFDDCFAYRAAGMENVAKYAKENAAGISPGWTGTFEEFLKTIEIL